jgi:amicyanin
MNRHFVLGTVAAASAGVLLLAGCSSSADSGAPATIDFGASASATPGMAGAQVPAMTMPMDTAAAPAATAPPGGGTPVSISNFAMEPATLTVAAGTTVTWTNHDDEPHTVVAKDGSFHSPAIDTNATYSFTFATPGTYDYICSIHPFMTATVVVTK